MIGESQFILVKLILESFDNDYTEPENDGDKLPQTLSSTDYLDEIKHLANTIKKLKSKGSSSSR